MKGSLSYYINLVKKFLKRFSVKLEFKEEESWQEKLAKTSKDVEEFLTKKEVWKDKLVSKKVNNFKTCESCNKTNYTVNLDSVVVILFTLLNLINNDQGETKKSFDNINKATPRDDNISEVSTEEEFFDIELEDAKPVHEAAVLKALNTKADSVLYLVKLGSVLLQ